MTTRWRVTNWVQKDHACQFGRTGYNESLKQICFGWISQQPERAKLGWDASSFAIGLCARSGKIANVLAGAMAKGFSFLSISVELPAKSAKCPAKCAK